MNQVCLVDSVAVAVVLAVCCPSADLLSLVLGTSSFRFLAGVKINCVVSRFGFNVRIATTPLDLVQLAVESLDLHSDRAITDFVVVDFIATVCAGFVAKQPLDNDNSQDNRTCIRACPNTNTKRCRL